MIGKKKKLKPKNNTDELKKEIQVLREKTEKLERELDNTFTGNNFD